MSFSDNSKLKDYLRNNSGSKLIDEIKKDFENNRKAWFDDKSNTFPFRRDGFPFEGDDIFGKKSDPGIKSHLEDLAKKHPEFAGDLKRPLWGEPIDKNWENAFTIPVSVEKGSQQGKPSTSQSNVEMNSHDGQKDRSNDQNPQHESNNASQSENFNESQEAKEPKRFTSKIEITPVNPYEENASSNSASNSQADTSNNYQPGTPNSGRKQPQVRHIPIFVEGRSEPVVPKNTGDFHPPNQFHTEQQIPIKRKFDVADGAPPKQEAPVQQIPVHIEKTKPKPAEKPKSEPPKQAENKPSTPVHKPNDPMQRIAEVQKEVDEYTAQVEKFSGTSRTDKAYLFLDEMLTRNLIKLDTIEVEGNEKLRVARKDVIRSIQKAIALLESKVPLPTPAEEPDEEMKSTEDSNAQSQMEVDEQSQNAHENQNSANDGGGENK